MRKITEQAVSAFSTDRNFKSGNTEVTTKTTDDGSLTETRMFLHGNLIATRINGKLEISNGGWSSNTTKERLNGIPGVNISQIKGYWYLNGKEWSGDWVVVEKALAPYRVMVFLNEWAKPVRANEAPDKVELIMDDHKCITYMGREYYLPEDANYGKDEGVYEYLTLNHHC